MNNHKKVLTDQNMILIDQKKVLKDYKKVLPNQNIDATTGIKKRTTRKKHFPTNILMLPQE